MKNDYFCSANYQCLSTANDGLARNLTQEFGSTNSSKSPGTILLDLFTCAFFSYSDFSYNRCLSVEYCFYCYSYQFTTISTKLLDYYCSYVYLSIDSGSMHCFPYSLTAIKARISALLELIA